MPAANEVARLKRTVEELRVVVTADLRPGSKSPMTSADRRMLRSEIEHSIQVLDELRTRLSGGS